MKNKIIIFYTHHKLHLNWLIIAVLLASAAFALGYLSGKSETHAPIIIQKNNF